MNDEFHITSESAELMQGSVTLRVSDALDLMIDNSDNYAALLLAERIKKFKTSPGINPSLEIFMRC